MNNQENEVYYYAYKYNNKWEIVNKCFTIQKTNNIMIGQLVTSIFYNDLINYKDIYELCIVKKTNNINNYNNILDRTSNIETLDFVLKYLKLSNNYIKEIYKEYNDKSNSNNFYSENKTIGNEFMNFTMYNNKLYINCPGFCLNIV